MTGDSLRRMISEAVAGAVERELPRMLRAALRAVLKEELDRATARLDEAEAPAPRYVDPEPAPARQERAQARSAMRSKLLDSSENPFAALYEGVEPVPEGEGPVPDVPVAAMFGGQMPRYDDRFLGGSTKPPPAPKPMLEAAREDARLAEYRRALDRPV